MSGEKSQTIELDVEGMTCAACAAAVSSALEGVDGVETARVSATTHKARVILANTTDNSFQHECLIDAIESIGFDAKISQEESNVEESYSDREVSAWRKRAVHAAWCLSLIFVAQFLPQVKSFICHAQLSLRLALQIIAAIYAQVFVAPIYYHGALTKPPGMDLLVSSASALTFGYSILNFFACCFFRQMEHTSFDSAVALLTFVTIGKYLEARAKREAGDAVAKIRRLEPATAVLLSQNNTQRIVPRRQIAIGECVLVSAGKAFPIDGILRSILTDDNTTEIANTSDNKITKKDASLYVDEAAVTGESLPVRKSIGDAVLGGTLCLGFGLSRRCVVEATRPGTDTAVSRIASLVEEAQLGGQTQIERTADAAARIFAPCVLVLSIGTLITWLIISHSIATALIFAVSVVVVACPCALGLAAPTAIICGCGIGARFGVLFKTGGEGLERLAETVQSSQRTLETNKKIAVAIDKTGTLTLGEPAVVEFKFWGEDIKEYEFLALAAAAERESDHPVAVAIRRYAELQLGAVVCTAYETVRGRASATGVECQIRRSGESKLRRICVGSLAFCLEHAAPHAWFDSEACVRHWRSERALAVSAVAIDGILVGALALADTPRPEAKAVVSWLEQVQGMSTYMLTGDDATTACAIARAVGISQHRVYANLKPADKANLLKSINAHIFVGDGINDAPALAAASIGIAVGDAAAIAADAADVVLVQPDLSGLVIALHLASTVVHRIHLNFLWASIYNVLLLPIAAGIAYPTIALTPGLAAACMAFSSISVVTSSLLLKRYSPPSDYIHLSDSLTLLREKDDSTLTETRKLQ